MNERIKELADIAHAMATGKNWSHDPEVGDMKFDDLYAKCFAELIIKECFDILYDNELGNRHIEHCIKEHFGVTE